MAVINAFMHWMRAICVMLNDEAEVTSLPELVTGKPALKYEYSWVITMFMAL